MANTPLASLPYPPHGDKPDIPSDIQALALAVEQQLVLSFANTTARDAAITAPVAGMMAFIVDRKWVTVYDGSAWIVVSALTPIGITATRSTNLTVAASSLTTVTYTAESYDSDGFLTPTSGTFTVPAGLGGMYLATFNFTLSAGITGYPALVMGGARYHQPTGSIGNGGMSVARRLAPADTVTSEIFKSDAGTVNLTNAALELYRIGP